MGLRSLFASIFPVEEWSSIEHDVDPCVIDYLEGKSTPQNIVEDLNKLAITKVSVVICARNEEKYLASTLMAVFSQSIKPFQVIIVDDGSIDKTFEIATSFGCNVVKLPFHQESFVGRPELAVRFNVALSKVSKFADYVLVLGADSVLPKKYIEYLLGKIEVDASLKVVSGHILNESFDVCQPRGSGRLIDASWWRGVDGLRFPVVWGWEAWLQYKALSMGFQAKSFYDIKFSVQRQSGLSLKQAECHGYSMNALGYFWIYAIARCFSRGPKFGKSMFIGYIKGKGLKKLDVAKYVSLSQRNRLVSKIFCFLKEVKISS